MVRVTECFECGAKENKVQLVFSPKGPILCKKCSEKMKK